MLREEGDLSACPSVGAPPNAPRKREDLLARSSSDRDALDCVSVSCPEKDPLSIRAPSFTATAIFSCAYWEVTLGPSGRGNDSDSAGNLHSLNATHTEVPGVPLAEGERKGLKGVLSHANPAYALPN